MPITLNPLRYPGAKRELINYIDTLLEAEGLKGCSFYEPFAGSAVVGFELLKRESVNHLVLVERDLLIYSFWYSVFNHTDDLCTLIRNTPITVKTWEDLCPLREVDTIQDDTDIVELGFAGLYFNRTNYSGILKANPIGGKGQGSDYKIDCRFNKQMIIKLIRELSEMQNKITLLWGDALTYLQRHQADFTRNGSFIYLDPPYYKKGKQLYRHFFSDEMHISLSNQLRALNNTNWLLSYDDDEYIRSLYPEADGVTRQGFYLDYSVHTSKQEKQINELLISNLRIPPVLLGAIDAL